MTKIDLHVTIIAMSSSLNYNRSGTISRGGGRIEVDFVFTLQVDPVLLKNFVTKISFLYPQNSLFKSASGKDF